MEFKIYYNNYKIMLKYCNTSHLRLVSTNDSRPTPKVEPKVEPSEQSSQASQQVCSTSKTVIKSEPVPQSCM